jgi:hypothetical protein
VNEEQWLACCNPALMLAFLRGKVGERHCRLFACACCRRIWNWITDERIKQAVEVCEDYADGRVGKRKFLSARRAAVDASIPRHPEYRQADEAVLGACSDRCVEIAEGTAASASNLISRVRGDYAERIERIAMCDLLRDIFGNPFRPAPTIGGAALAWNDRLVSKLAQAAYDERSLPDGGLDPTRLAVLADALEEAGVAESSLLEHLRGPGPHVRGCFALDAIRAKTERPRGT